MSETPDALVLVSAVALAHHALASAGDRSQSVTVTVTDAAGYVIVKLRADGADLLSIEMSESKARTAALSRMSTADLAEASRPDGPLFGLLSYGGGRIVALPGGEPVTIRRKVVGAIGVSGCAPAVDREIALSALHRWAPEDVSTSEEFA